ncbi:hypothetical protein [Streptomyces sp. NPDC008125]|uniref:hypothetical protein n=1 Tax=Streptomyces sp. NPDC008125 TaxID=3364811 RepID=UPI0036F037B6
MDLYRVGYDGRPAFPGHENLRLSTDLASGADGVLLVLGAAAGGPRRAAVPVTVHEGGRKPWNTAPHTAARHG